MSLKAGGGNLGTIFSTLTYSDMMAELGRRYGIVESEVLWLLGDSKVMQLKTPHTIASVDRARMRAESGWHWQHNHTTDNVPCISRYGPSR